MKQTSLADQQVRCAIYTRLSLTPNPDRFSSIKSQRTLCSSYIASQKPKGWVELPKTYDDPGWTGANLRRPALQDLLTDIEHGLIDVVVVYKLDRITRTLLDFVRLIDLLDQSNVSFVSVTQNFDTGDSTGRLIRNILLTFAQFEREIASDRLRDKFSAMKECGLFVGGHPPYGFDLADKKLIVNDGEAEVVRWMFGRYLETCSYLKVARELGERKVVRRSRISKRGKLVQGRPICASAVFNMLGNPVYVGRVRNRGREWPGIHDPIVDQQLWDDVQKLRRRRTRAKVVQIHRTDILRDLMVDSFGRKMGVFRDYRYNEDGKRYYISNQNEWGRRHGVRRYRARADELEQLVLSSIGILLADRARIRSMMMVVGTDRRWMASRAALTDVAARHFKDCSLKQCQSALKAMIERIELSDDRLAIVVRNSEVARFLEWDGTGIFRGNVDAWAKAQPVEVLEVSAATISIKRSLAALVRRPPKRSDAKPRASLVKMIRKARLAQAALDSREEVSVTELATRIHCHPDRFARLARLNYLAPDIVASILDGTQPSGLTGQKLLKTELPMDWAMQRRMLGFPDQPDYLKAAPGW